VIGYSQRSESPSLLLVYLAPHHRKNQEVWAFSPISLLQEFIPSCFPSPKHLSHKKTLLLEDFESSHRPCDF